MSIVNIGADMFAFLRRFAWSPPPEPPDPDNLDLDALQRAMGYNKRGVERIGRGERDAAREDFEAALALRGQFAPALTNLGNMLLEEERVDEAIAMYERALRVDDTYANAYRSLGIAYKRQGRTAEAVRALRRADRPKRRGRFF
jgi:tetratricopeptide (TPR) repeat protein